MAPAEASLTGDADIDAVAAAIGRAVEADRDLGGLCIWIEAEALEREDTGPENAAGVRWGQTAVIAQYSTSSPL